MTHRKRRPDLDEKIKPPEVDDPEEGLRELLQGLGAEPADHDEDEELPGSA
jgi:hypothetical protein